MRRVAITNIGALVSGRLGQPLLNASSLLIEDGLIARLGWSDRFDDVEVDLVVDAQGTTVAPGLIDSHVHMVLDNYAPGLTAPGFIDLYVHGGNTTLINASSSRMIPGWRDVPSVKALALLGNSVFQRLRPSGAKCLAGTLLIEPELTKEDFAEMARLGVRLAKHGFGHFPDSAAAVQHVRWAQEQGIKVMVHTGGPYRPGGLHTRAADLLKLRPDVCMHVNGGGATLSESEVGQLVRESDLVLEICTGANTKLGIYVCNLARELGALDRIIIGSDTPTGFGLVPLGVMKTVADLSSMAGLSAPEAIALATGNTARVFDLQQGVIEVGRPADLIVMDKLAGGDTDGALGDIERGDIPAISAVLIDGIVRALPSRVSGVAHRPAKVERKTMAAHECLAVAT